MTISLFCFLLLLRMTATSGDHILSPGVLQSPLLIRGRFHFLFFSLIIICGRFFFFPLFFLLFSFPLFIFHHHRLPCLRFHMLECWWTIYWETRKGKGNMNQEVLPNSIVARTILNFSQVHSVPAESVMELVVYLSHLNSPQEYKRQSSWEIIQPCQKKMTACCSIKIPLEPPLTMIVLKSTAVVLKVTPLVSRQLA